MNDDLPHYHPQTAEERVRSLNAVQAMREERIKRLMVKYNCTQEDAIRFIDLREEGHSVYAAAVMAGLRDPSY